MLSGSSAFEADRAKGELVELSHDNKLTLEQYLWNSESRPWQGLFRPFTFYLDLYKEVVVVDDIDVDEIDECMLFCSLVLIFYNCCQRFFPPLC